MELDLEEVLLVDLGLDQCDRVQIITQPVASVACLVPPLLIVLQWQVEVESGNH